MINRIIPASTLAAILLSSTLLYAQTSTTNRIPQFDNDKISIWETEIFPSSDQILKMHRHEHDRVLVAFTDGVLKITNDRGKYHYLKLHKNHAYYLKKDVGNEQHTDENISPHVIKVLVMEFKK